MRFTLAATLLLTSVLAGCGTTTVSPAIASNPGVRTAIGPDGYPILTSVTFTRSARASADDRANCTKSQINDIESSPVKTGSSIEASGKTSFYFAEVGMSKAFRYSLKIRGDNNSVYTFDRLRYINNGSQGGPIMASKWWSPEYLVEELESITDRIDACTRSR
ncbi:hypothetical protein [Pseudomonas tussilaginis]|uniref:hypothetical protein n=1 Tax=Pseudomonas putida TaxID=303 RepID=UPI002363C141|nr:hypothetical protein [Pseudomonas putida]MDD1979633.1 hypothetical protein [Pseudomonas putida]